MAENPIQTSTHNSSPGLVQKYAILNTVGERLIGILDDAKSDKLCVLCHGFRSSKEDITLCNLASTFVQEGLSSFRFDFSGNGESDGEFRYGNYQKEAEDLRSVILFWRNRGQEVVSIVGHSKGGNAVLLYASKYGDVPNVVNISGRLALERGMAKRLGKNFVQEIEEKGVVFVKDESGNVEYQVTRESWQDRLNTDMKSAALQIPETCRVLTVHGSKDEIVTVEDAYDFDKLISSHTLRIVQGGDHTFRFHQKELQQLVLHFIKTNVQTRALM
ncbi:hypothetical protein O6H91_11G037800 [Diphasiastrum complanatum]|uniref:Uncharacterized protein n=1 Tax=Diphasiastrum complanatum TaxID=34168 RepID=A0ACC2C879_DIPCM|nr:hypothetical protein O6H91_11G037800 [Diphasiastrum complanatum]